MKKLKLLILSILLLFPLIVNAEGNVSITKITKQNVTGDAYEVDEPTFNGLNVNYNVSFHAVGDSITYIATVQNKDSDAYKIENKNSFSSSGYMTYEFKFSDNTNIIKANETKDMYITIKYTKEVPDTLLVNGEYKEQNQMDLVLVNNNGKILNPNTKSTIFFIVLICLLLVISIIVFRKNKKASTLLLTLALLLPVTAYALKEIKITLNTQVVIEKELKYCLYSPSEIGPTIEPNKTYYPYTEGGTLNNPFLESTIIDGFTASPQQTPIAIFVKTGYYKCVSEAFYKYGNELEILGDNITVYGKFKATNEKETKGDSPLNDALNICYDTYLEYAYPDSKIKRHIEGCYYPYSAPVGVVSPNPELID